MGPPGLPGPKTSVPPVPLAAKEPSPQSAPVRPHPVMCCTLLPVTIPNSPGSASCPGLPSTVLVTLSRCWSARPLQAPAAAYEKPEWSSAPDAEKHAPSFAPPLLPAARLPAGPFHLVAIQDCSPSPVPLRTPPPCRRPRRAARRCLPPWDPHGLTAAPTRRFPYFLEVLKNGTVIDKIDAAGKELILIGRNADSCDLVPRASSVTARAPAPADARGAVR